LVLRVRHQDVDWHADVGFGAGTLLEPIPFGPGSEHEQSGWLFRVVEDGDELVLQTQDAGEWRDLYGFVPQPVPLVDIETSNWFTSTYPRSPFVTGLIAALQHQDGTRILLSDWAGLGLTEHAPGTGPAITPVERDEIPRLLETHFGLPGFTLDGEGRVTTAAGG
jgi:arylamine N-acetyltransferase